MAFIRGAWRVLVAVKDALVLLFLLGFFALVYAALSFSRPERGPLSGALLVRLDGPVVEQPQEADAFATLGGDGDAREHRLRDVVHAIETGARDSAVKAIVLDLDDFGGGGQVAMARIGAALDTARKAGKPVLAYASTYSDDGYQIAAHAGEVWMSPLGAVALTGPGGSQLYYKGLLDRLGVTAHVYRVGTYKSFVEPFIRADQSPEARQANLALVNAVWSTWRDDVRRARPAAAIDPYIADPVGAARRAGGDGGKAALAARLVDKLGDDIAFGERIAQIAGAGNDDRPGGFAAIHLDDYLARHPADAVPGKVGVLTIAGDIVDGKAAPGSAGGDTIAHLLADALAADSIRALVLRVDSPGGSVTASEKIRQAVLRAKARGIPVVVSMGNVAASGGYWVSTPADRIFAEPATITGSIGVFGIVPSFEATLARIGITTDGVKATPLSGEPNIVGGISPAFDAIAQAGVESYYRRFVGLVAKSRGLTVEGTDRIAQGRVWDGGTARQLRLVDRFGGIEEAVAEAARLARLTGGDARPRYIETPPDPIIAALAALRRDERQQDDGAARDWLTRQSRVQQRWAWQAVADARGLIEGSAVRAACLECRAFEAPRAAAPSPGVLATVAGWLGR